MLKTAVVILNYNGKHLLQQFLPKVIEYSHDANIYVADNASTDNSVSFIKENYPSVKLIQNKENYGFAKGYNEALQFLEEDIICLLNSDVEVSKNWLLPVLEEFKTHPKTSIVQPKILDFKNPTKFEYAGASGGFIDKFGYPFCRGRIFDNVETDSGQYNNNTDIFWASGACMFIRTAVWKTLNGFDERFFAHMEEIDLGWRAFNMGHSAKCIPESTVYHIGGGTLSYGSPQKTYLNFRNSLYMLTKNVPEKVPFIILIRLILDGIAGIKFLLQFQPSHFFAVLRAHFHFYFNLSECLNYRYNVKSDRKYYKVKSVVWSYFIKGCKRFNCL